MKDRMDERGRMEGKMEERMKCKKERKGKK